MGVMNLYFIKDIPIQERPRERLASMGAKRLSDEELLALLLRTGTKKQSVIELAKHLLYTAPGLSALGAKTLTELAEMPGIGLAKASIILAAIELGKRIASDHATGRMIANPSDVQALLRPEMAGLKQEHLVALYLDLRSRLIAKETIFVGGLNQSIVHPREVFRYAVKVSAYQIILVHNHPSGDARPSDADLTMTRAFVEAGEMMQIRVVDHLIITATDCVSILHPQKK
jgi:DNA repair protein RadC